MTVAKKVELSDRMLELIIEALQLSMNYQLIDSVSANPEFDPEKAMEIRTLRGLMQQIKEKE